MGKPPSIKVGDEFGSWIVEEYFPNRSICLCRSCNTYHIIGNGELKAGRTESCWM